VHWDESSRSGRVRLKLGPAYEAASGVVGYTREFVLAPGSIVCRDLVQLDTPHTLSWLFQGRRDTGVALQANGHALFGGDTGISVEARPAGFAVEASLHETPVVYSYSSAAGFARFDHIRYDTKEAVSGAAIDFVIRW
jgi:hypothetical protein